MKLLIDDIRGDDSVDFICRNSVSARIALRELRNYITEVHFDHDLGLHSNSGYKILNWALERDLIPDKVVLVTANPVGFENMQRALEAYGYKKIGLSTFEKYPK